MISLNPLARNWADKVPVSKVLYFLFFLLHKNIMMMIKNMMLLMLSSHSYCRTGWPVYLATDQLLWKINLILYFILFLFSLCL